jgi:hypothetical protein
LSALFVARCEPLDERPRFRKDQASVVSGRDFVVLIWNTSTGFIIRWMYSNMKSLHYPPKYHTWGQVSDSLISKKIQ